MTVGLPIDSNQPIQIMCHLQTLTPASRTLSSGEGLKTKAPFQVLFVVDPERFELSTFSMPLRRAPNCAMGPCLRNFLVSHGAPNSPGRGLRALWALNTILLFPMALPIPRGGDCVRYGALLIEMDLEGFEPSTSSVRLKRAPNCATGPYSIQISRMNILIV